MPFTASIAPLLVVTALVACAAPAPSPGASVAASASAAPAGSQAERSAAPATSVAASPLGSASTPPGTDPPPLALDPVATGLLEPIGIATGPPGTLLVHERAGRLIGVDLDAGSTWTVVDLRDRVRGGGEQGLLGVVLHPDWPDDARAFVHYTDRNGDTVLSEFRSADAAETSPTLDPASEAVLLRVDQPYANHNGGQLAFDADGYLWMALGDGGSGGDPHGHGQDAGTLLGSILRLDVSDAGRYAVPSDNPFVDGGGAPEVYLYGLRNPWRFSFDPEAATVWIADVGQNALEEIDRLPLDDAAGANLGWNLMEGSRCFADPGCSPEGLVLPVAEYATDMGCAVTGGYVYRGDALPALAGWYLFSDFCSGLVFGVSDAAAAVTGGVPLVPPVLLESGASVASFGEDADGELYLADLGSGTIYRLVGG